MERLKYTQDFAKDFIEDMDDYFLKTSNSKNFIVFNKELNENLDFDWLVKELKKNNYLFEFDKQNNRWKVAKTSQ